MRVVFCLLLMVFSASVFAGFDGDPIYEQADGTNGASFVAVRPFYSATIDPAGERWRKDYFWPLYTRKGLGSQTYGRLLFFGFFNGFHAEGDKHRNWILPFWFSGVDGEGEGYFALFPLGGTIHDFVGRDRVTFALFPLYATSSVNEVGTTSLLWPVYSRSKGDRVDRFRVFPLYGRSTLAGEYEKRFVLWPFYNSVDYTSDRLDGGGFILFPVYGQVKTKLADNYWLIPPFFRYVSGENQRVIHAPWPFVQWADGQVYKRYFWPLYGKKQLGTLTREFYGWPFVWSSKTEYAHDTFYRKNVAPFFYYESDVAKAGHEKWAEGETFSRYWKVWPLMSWERNGLDSRFRTLDLWPMRNTPGIERNWAPYWSLYRRMNVDGEVGHHLLWGLYRQTKGEEGFEWSLLKGLAGYKSSPSGTSFRFCFMNFGDKGD